MLDTFKDAGFALGSARQPVTGLRRGGPRIGIDTHTAGHAGGGMAGDEILPVLSFAEQLRQLVVADPPAATGRPGAGLLDRLDDQPGRRRTGRATASQAVLVGAQQDADHAIIVRRAGLAAQHHALVGAGIKRRALAERGKEDQRLDPGVDPRRAGQDLSPSL